MHPGSQRGFAGGPFAQEPDGAGGVFDGARVQRQDVALVENRPEDRLQETVRQGAWQDGSGRFVAHGAPVFDQKATAVVGFEEPTIGARLESAGLVCPGTPVVRERLGAYHNVRRHRRTLDATKRNVTRDGEAADQVAVRQRWYRNRHRARFRCGCSLR